MCVVPGLGDVQLRVVEGEQVQVLRVRVTHTGQKLQVCVAVVIILQLALTLLRPGGNIMSGFC